MAKHTQTIRQQCLSVFGHFVGLVFKGLRRSRYLTSDTLTTEI